MSQKNKIRRIDSEVNGSIVIYFLALDKTMNTNITLYHIMNNKNNNDKQLCGFPYADVRKNNCEYATIYPVNTALPLNIITYKSLK